jgi:hypothetical protein
MNFKNKTLRYGLSGDVAVNGAGGHNWPLFLHESRVLNTDALSCRCSLDIIYYMSIPQCSLSYDGRLALSAGARCRSSAYGDPE